MPARELQCGVTLIELLLAVVISSIVLAAISGLIKLGVEAQSNGRTLNELKYQGRFALERMADKSRTTAAKVLTTPAANTTGDWFAPSGCTGTACLMYCLNGGAQLIETTTADTGCAGTTAIANNVSVFSAALPTGASAIDRSIASISLTMGSGANLVSLAASVRLGGGTQ